MCTGRRRHGAQSALSHSTSTKFPSVQNDTLWPMSIFVRLEHRSVWNEMKSYNCYTIYTQRLVILQADLLRTLITNEKLGQCDQAYWVYRLSRLYRGGSRNFRTGADPFSSSPSLLSLPVPSLPSLSSPLPFPLEIRPP